MLFSYIVIIIISSSSMCLQFVILRLWLDTRLPSSALREGHAPAADAGRAAAQDGGGPPGRVASEGGGAPPSIRGFLL